MKRIQSGFSSFSVNGDIGYAEKEKLRRTRWRVPLMGRFQAFITRMNRKWKVRALIAILLLACYILFYTTRKSPRYNVSVLDTDFSAALCYHWRRTSWLGGGEKYVIILAANIGGGVMEWKGAREWAIERDSVRNKRKYVARWGYDLEIVDMSTKKRYAHEWRESWEKVDSIRNSFKKYPKAEW
jgi:mannan polymerase II complex MNN10 subunit